MELMLAYGPLSARILASPLDRITSGVASVATLVLGTDDDVARGGPERFR